MDLRGAQYSGGNSGGKKWKCLSTAFLGGEYGYFRAPILEVDCFLGVGKRAFCRGESEDLSYGSVYRARARFQFWRGDFERG
jgi:hypothetical protein